MILEITNAFQLPAIFKMAEKIPNVKKSVMEEMLTKALSRQDAKIIADIQGNEYVGFIFASVESLNGEDIIFIHLSYIKPGLVNSGHELLARLKLWSKFLGIKGLVASTHRSVKGFEHKYKFKYFSTLIRREV